MLTLWLRPNPRLFPPPAGTRSWISRGVLGERVWLNRAAVPIPPHHAMAAAQVQGASPAFLAAGAWGIVARDFRAALLGFHGAALAEFWFVDRMVWLFGDMKDREPRCAACLR